MIEFNEGEANGFPGRCDQANLNFLQTLHRRGSHTMERTAGPGRLCHSLVALGVRLLQLAKAFA